MIRVGLLFITFVMVNRAGSTRTVDTSCKAPWTAKSVQCQYENDDDPSVTEKGVSEEDIQLILDEHNRYRSAVKPKARQMQKMYWSDELEATAQKWAQTCNKKHDSFANRKVPGWRVAIGQNGAFGHSSWAEAIAGWHGEVKLFTYGKKYTSRSTPKWTAIGHYTQVVRDISVLVGCGYAKCGSTKFYFCNYSYTNNGRTIGRPYVRLPANSSSCIGCPDNCSDNLCDCNGLLCKNGKIDLKTCSCKCRDNYWTGDDCGTRVCAGLTCKNGGKLNVDSCTCTCSSSLWTGRECDQQDPSQCKDPGYCTVPQPYGYLGLCQYSNVKQECPKMCNICQ